MEETTQDKRLPDFSPVSYWELAPSDYEPQYYNSVYPSVQKLKDGRLIIDQCLSRPKTGFHKKYYDLLQVVINTCNYFGWSKKTLTLRELQRRLWQFEIKVFNDCDHPNLEKLPKNTPRTVKQLYRRDWQLRILRSTDYMSTGSEISKAEEAWENFILNNSKNQKQPVEDKLKKESER